MLKCEESGVCGLKFEERGMRGAGSKVRKGMYRRDDEKRPKGCVSSKDRKGVYGLRGEKRVMQAQMGGKGYAGFNLKKWYVGSNVRKGIYGLKWEERRNVGSKVRKVGMWNFITSSRDVHICMRAFIIWSCEVHINKISTRCDCLFDDLLINFSDD